MRFKKLVSSDSNYFAYIVGVLLLLLLLLAAAIVWLCIIPVSFDPDIVTDSIQVIWTDENMQQIRLTDREQGKKVAELLKHYGRRRMPMRSAEHRREKGDLEISGMDRMEFHVNRPEYGMLAEGDRGTLTFQGTRYLGFERNV